MGTLSNIGSAISSKAKGAANTGSTESMADSGTGQIDAYGAKAREASTDAAKQQMLNSITEAVNSMMKSIGSMMKSAAQSG